MPINPPHPYPIRCKSWYRLRSHNNRPGLSQPHSQPRRDTHQPIPPHTQPSINPGTVPYPLNDRPRLHQPLFQPKGDTHQPTPPPTQPCINPGTVPDPLSNLLGLSKPSPSPRGTPTKYIPNPPEIPVPSRTPINNRTGLSQRPSQPKGDTHQPPYPTRYKSRYHPITPQQLSWTIPTPLPAQSGHPATHPTPDPTRYKSRYCPGPFQLWWTIPIPSQSMETSTNPSHPLPNPL